MTVAGSGEPVDNWAAGAGANYFYSVANINRERGDQAPVMLLLLSDAWVAPAPGCRGRVRRGWYNECDGGDGGDAPSMVMVVVSSISSAAGDQ